MPKVLLIDDDAAFRKALRPVLEDNAFIVLEAATGHAGLAKAARDAPDLVILDLVMPRLQGTDVCLSLKKEPATAAIPVLILTGNDREGQEIACLDLGADDYLTKPVRGERLLAHCRALLRRHGLGGASQDYQAISIGPLRLDYPRKVVSLSGKEYPHLTPKEFDLLYSLALHSPAPRRREEIYREVWDMEPPSEVSLRTVEVHVRRIRLKLGWRMGEWLLAVTGRGYCLKALD